MGSLTPYITPAILKSAPTGISWSTIPAPGSSATAQLIEQQNMCMRATATAEGFCNQILRATIDTQIESGPNRVVTIDPATGVTRFRTKQWPVLAVVSAQYSPNASWPRGWVTIPAGMYEVQESVPMNTGNSVAGGAADGGTSILVAPGYVSWQYGRNGFRLQVSYLNGWPHAGIASAVAVNDTNISVDDVTGYGIATPTAPIVPNIFDGINTEAVTVTGVTATNGSTGAGAYGPGTLQLATGATQIHAGPTNEIASCLISTMPMAVQRAVILLAVHEALVRGSTATTVPRQPGAQISGGGGSTLDAEAFELLLPYRRVI